MSTKRGEYGEDNYNHVLKDRHVEEIRKSDDLIKVLAHRYGVSNGQISKIRNNRSRKYPTII